MIAELSVLGKLGTTAFGKHDMTVMSHLLDRLSGALYDAFFSMNPVNVVA